MKYIFQKLDEHGGFDVVSEKKSWSKVSKQCGFSATSGSTLKNHYSRWVLPFIQVRKINIYIFFKFCRK